MNRIVPIAGFWEVWSGNYLVCTCVSYAAAREELAYLNSLIDPALSL